MLICSILLTIGLSCGENTLGNAGFYEAWKKKRITPSIYSERLVDKNVLHNMFWTTTKRYGLKKEPRGQDYWSEDLYSLNYPDCEDYALHIRKKLIGAGFIGGNLAWIYDSRRKQNHIVLIVPTKQGAYVVDTNYPNDLKSFKDFSIHMRRHNQKIVKVLKNNLQWVKVK